MQMVEWSINGDCRGKSDNSMHFKFLKLSTHILGTLCSNVLGNSSRKMCMFVCMSAPEKTWFASFETYSQTLPGRKYKFQQLDVVDCDLVTEITA